MSHALHTRRADTGFTTAQLGLYLFLAADAMFYGALYSSHALLSTATAAWTREHPLPMALLGGTALAALLAGAVTPRAGAHPYRNTALVNLAGALALAALIGTLLYLGAPPAKSTYLALIHLYAAVTGIHALGAALAALLIARHDAQDAAAVARRKLLGTFNAATAVFWAVALGLALFV